MFKIKWAAVWAIWTTSCRTVVGGGYLVVAKKRAFAQPGKIWYSE